MKYWSLKQVLDFIYRLLIGALILYGTYTAFNCSEVYRKIFAYCGYYFLAYFLYLMFRRN